MAAARRRDRVGLIGRRAGLAVVRRIGLAACLLAAQTVQASPLEFERTGLAWTAEEVAGASRQPLDEILRQAARDNAAPCSAACLRMRAIWTHLLDALPAAARSPGLRLHVVQLPGIEAFSVSAGDVVIGEPYVEAQLMTDEEVAFVLAHELAHVVLQHERQSLTAARAVLPPVPRSVRDMYVELAFNVGLQRLLEPVLLASELEADEFGLQLATLAGYAPHQQLMFLVESAEAEEPQQIVITHPPARQRILHALLRWPLVLRMWQQSAPQAAPDPAVARRPPGGRAP